jgi:hypothetical protein
MFRFEKEIQMGNRLELISGKVGQTLWQLQVLEEVIAKFFVLVVQAKQGMGREDVEVKIGSALKGTFGSTIKELIKEQKMPEALEPRFKHLLAERNWLVHRSRSDSKDAVLTDKGCRDLIVRLDAIAEETTMLLEHVVVEADAFVQSHGVKTENIDESVKRTMEQWFDEIEP